MATSGATPGAVGGASAGKAISYTATSGETYLTDEKGKPTAAIFSTSYVKDGKDPNRPVT